MSVTAVVLLAPVLWLGAGLVLFVLAYLLTAVLSLTYRLLASDPSPANDPAAALGTIFPILVGMVTLAPFVLLGAALTTAGRSGRP